MGFSEAVNVVKIYKHEMLIIATQEQALSIRTTANKVDLMHFLMLYMEVGCLLKNATIMTDLDHVRLC